MHESQAVARFHRVDGGRAGGKNVVFCVKIMNLAWGPGGELGCLALAISIYRPLPRGAAGASYSTACQLSSVSQRDGVG